MVLNGPGRGECRPRYAPDPPPSRGPGSRCAASDAAPTASAGGFTGLMTTAGHLAAIELLRTRGFDGEPDFHLAELATSEDFWEDDGTRRVIVEDRYEAERDGLGFLLTARWGTPGSSTSGPSWNGAWRASRYPSLVHPQLSHTEPAPVAGRRVLDRSGCLPVGRGAADPAPRGTHHGRPADMTSGLRRAGRSARRRDGRAAAGPDREPLPLRPRAPRRPPADGRTPRPSSPPSSAR